MPESKLSLWRVVTTDYAIFNGLMFPVISLIVIIISVGNPLLSGMLAIGSAIALITAGVRFIRILAIFSENQVEEAVIAGVYSSRKWVMLTCEYTYHGEMYRSKHNLLRSKTTSKYKLGDRVQVLVDWSKPSNSVIRELFSSQKMDI